MDDKLKLTPDEALLKEARVLERLAAIYGEIARRGGVTSSTEVQPSTETNAAALVRLPLTDAIIEVLRAAKKPQSPKQIWAALEKAGYEVTAENPRSSVKWALRKILPTNGDLVSVGWGQWVLRSTISKTKLDRLLSKRAGTGGRTKEEHRKATLDGMAKVRARGQRLGAPLLLTVDKATAIKHLMEQGVSGPKIARQIGISPSLFYSRKKALMAWNIGEPWPPTENPTERQSAESATEAPHIRLVK